MNNKKGFTLVEVLGVIVILGILALLVTNGIMGYFEEGKKTYNDKVKDQLMIAGKNYFSNNRYLLPTEVTDKKYAYVTVPEMQSNNYIKNEFLDSEGRKCTESYVFVRNSKPGTNTYEYTPCLICEGINYSENNGYCDPSLWKIESVEDGEGTDNSSMTTTGDFSCFGTYEIATQKTTITASSDYKINRMYYIRIADPTNETDLELTEKEKSDGRITKKVFNNIPRWTESEVYIEDMYGNISQKCNIEDCKCPKLSLGYDQGTASCDACVCNSPKIEKTIDGVIHCAEPTNPTCTFGKLPSVVGTSGVSFPVTCTNEVNIKNLNSAYIVPNDSNATISSINYGYVNSITDRITNKPTATTDHKLIKYTGTYTPSKQNFEGTGQIKIKVGLVGNESDTNKQNAQVISNIITIDTKAPVITYKVISGSTMTSQASGESYTGYKDSVQIQVQCTDSGSGVKTFTVDGTATSSPKTVTYNTRGNHTLSISCTDKAGNTATKNPSYRVCISSSNCSKCGIKSYKSCPNSSCNCTAGYYDYYCPNGGSLSGQRCNTHTGPYKNLSICNSNCKYGECVKPGSGAYGATVAKPWVCMTSYTASRGNYHCTQRASCPNSSCGVNECKSCYYCS